jgi:hypothetical protein
MVPLEQRIGLRASRMDRDRRHDPRGSSFYMEGALASAIKLIPFSKQGATMVNLLFSINGRIPRWKFWLVYLPILVGSAPLIIFIERFGGNNPIFILLVIALYVWMSICLAAILSPIVV